MVATKADKVAELQVLVESLVDRVTALEKEVSALKKRLREEDVVKSQQALNAIFGRSADDPTFDEAVRRGREWRRKQPKCRYPTPTTSAISCDAMIKE